MENYILRKIGAAEYYLLCMNFEGVLNNLNDIEKEKEIEKNKGLLVIDQLLVAGNGKNRFISCSFSLGEIKLSTAKNISPKSEYKLLTGELLRKNLTYLNNSILTERQRDMIKEGYVI